MVYRTRLFKVLATLVVSMIAGALLLAGLEPGQNASHPALLLHASGQTEPPLTPADTPRWEEVVVRCEPAGQRNTLLFTGNRAGPPAHLRVDRWGLIEVQPAWQRQQRLPEAPEAVIIRVELPPSATRLGTTQVQTIKSLLQHLDAAFALPADRVRVESTHPNVLEPREQLLG